MESGQVRTVRLGVTYRCNGRCRHCSAADFVRPGSEELSREEIRRICEEVTLVDRGEAMLFLYGGEPTVRPDLPEIVRDAKDYFDRVSIDSNGLRVDREYAARLGAAGLDCVYLSLLGPDAPRHAAVAGIDSFARVLEAARQCKQEGIAVKLAVTAMRELVADGAAGLASLIALARDGGFDGVRVLLPSLTGRLASEPSAALTEGERDVVFSLCDGDFAFVASEGSTTYRCHALFGGYYYISPYGEVTPCVFVPLVLGNVRREPLASIARRAATDVPWLNREPAFRAGSGRCFMTEPGALERFDPGAVDDRDVRWDNVVDLEGAPLQTALAGIRAGSHRHVEIRGGEACSAGEIETLGSQLRDASLVASLSLPAERVLEPGLADALARGELRQLRLRLGVQTAQAALAPAIALFRSAALSVLLEVGQATLGEAGAIDTLMALQVDQIDLVEPGVGGAAPRRRLVASRGALMQAFEPGDGRWYSPRSFLALGEHLGAGEAAQALPRLRYSVDLRRLARGLSMLDSALPELRRRGQRLQLVRVGDADHNWRGLNDYRLERVVEHAETLRRVFGLADGNPDVLELRGFGPPLFRPWMTARQISAMHKERFWPGRQDEVPWARLVREALLRDSDPPVSEEPADGEASADWAAGGYGGHRPRWRPVEPRVREAHRSLLEGALEAEGLPGGGDEELIALTRRVLRSLAADESEERPAILRSAESTPVPVGGAEAPRALPAPPPWLDALGLRMSEGLAPSGGAEDVGEELWVEGAGLRGLLLIARDDAPQPFWGRGHHLSLLTSPRFPPRPELVRVALPALLRVLDHYLARPGSDRRTILTRALHALADAPRSPLPGYRLSGMSPLGPLDGARAELMTDTGGRLVLFLLPADGALPLWRTDVGPRVWLLPAPTAPPRGDGGGSPPGWQSARGDGGSVAKSGQKGGMN